MNLKELLNHDLVENNVEVEDWEDAVRAVGKLMVQSGAVEKRYIDGMIRTAKELGPYIVVAPGIALPHSRPEDGVKRTCMAFITLKKPVEFGNEINDPVDLVVAFGAVDKKQHIEALRDLATILGDKKNVQSLREAKNTEELLKIIWSQEAK